MRRSARGVLVGTACAASALAGVAATTQRSTLAGCSQRSVSGAYGFSVAGTNVRTGSYALVGRFVADGTGRLQGEAVQSVSGHVVRNTISGVYSVAADCTGTSGLELGTDIKANLRFVLVNGGDEVFLMVVDSGTIETGVAKRIAAKGRAP
jgi:hypothetical protein